MTAGVTVVLARLLTPSDYGLFAIALSIQLVGQNLAELGLPAALVRMEKEPSLELQAATIGFLQLVTTGLAAAMLIAAFAVTPMLNGKSNVLEVAAITLLAMPLYATRAVPMAMMDRRLRFGRVAAVEVADTLGFNAFALTAAVAGLGVFSLAGAVPVGAGLGMLVAWRLGDSARRPNFSFAPVRPLIGFGSQASALGVLYLGRDLGYVAVIGAFGGASMAGFYAMAKRLFSFPTALSAAVARVGLPALSQSGEKREQRASSMIAQIAVICGLPLAMVAGAITPLISVVLGSEWLPTEDIVLYGSLSMLLTAAVAVVVNAYKLAIGKPAAALAAVIAELILGFGLTAALVGSLDEAGIGIAMSLGTLLAATILFASSEPPVRSSLGRLVRAAMVSAVAALSAYLLPFGDGVNGLIGALLVVAIVWAALATLLLREDMVRIIGMIRGLISRRRDG